MQTSRRQRAAGFDLAGDAFAVDRAFGLQRNDGRTGIGLVALLDRGLHGTEFGGVHFLLPFVLMGPDLMPYRADVTTTSPRPRSIWGPHLPHCDRANGPATSARGA